MIIFLLLVEIVFIFDVDGDVGLNFHLWRLVWKIYPYMDTLHVWQRRFYYFLPPHRNFIGCKKYLQLFSLILKGFRFSLLSRSLIRFITEIFPWLNTVFIDQKSSLKI